MARRPAFDPDARLTITRARTLGGVLRQLGPVGKRNGPRTGAGRRTTTSNEAYLGRRFILDSIERRRISFPLSVEHGDAPDLIIRHGGGVLRLEVTEACPEVDGHLFATATSALPIGDYSETGTCKAIVDLRAQLQEAIDRKKVKPYAADSSLLIYPNSEAAQWCHFFVKDRPASFLAELQIRPLQTVYVYWRDAEFFTLTSRSRRRKRHTALTAS